MELHPKDRDMGPPSCTVCCWSETLGSNLVVSSVTLEEWWAEKRIWEFPCEYNHHILYLEPVVFWEKPPLFFSSSFHSFTPFPHVHSIPSCLQLPASKVESRVLVRAFRDPRGPILVHQMKELRDAEVLKITHSVLGPLIYPSLC